MILEAKTSLKQYNEIIRYLKRIRIIESKNSLFMIMKKNFINHSNRRYAIKTNLFTIIVEKVYIGIELYSRWTHFGPVV